MKAGFAVYRVTIVEADMEPLRDPLQTGTLLKGSYLWFHVCMSNSRNNLSPTPIPLAEAPVP